MTRLSLSPTRYSGWTILAALLGCGTGGSMNALVVPTPARGAPERFEPLDRSARLMPADTIIGRGQFPECRIIFTYPNADNGGRALIPLLEHYAQQQPGRVLAIPSLGFRRYLAAFEHAAAVVGNSSSGIIEIPAFGIPTVNIGVRQFGRLAAESVLHCPAETEAIVGTLHLALSDQFGARCREAVNPFGQGNAAKQVTQVLGSLYRWDAQAFSRSG